MEPPTRSGCIGTLPQDLELACYAAHLGTDTDAYVTFRHACDGYRECKPLRIASIERKQYPNPHIVRGVLTIDRNRPGEDASDDVEDVEVVIELWSYPRALVYRASGYVPVVYSTINGWEELL